MSLSPSHDKAATALAEEDRSESRSKLTELAIAIAFAAAVSAAMMGWLYVLALCLWDGASWLLS
jgi:hypothetical protein